MNQRETAADRLDRLYLKSIRCPYCHTRIEKGTTKCPNCGITKEQIYHANLVLRKKKQPKPPVLYSKVRPASIPFWKMAIGAMFGFLGIHCFVAKRKWRGLVILMSTLLFFILGSIFHPAVQNLMLDAHPFRAMFEDKGWFFPFDFFALIAGVMWIWDWCAILLGKFKYPVVIKGEDAPQ